LIGLNKNPADFRVLVQKNGTGNWGVTSLVARLGQNNVVSNIARGGSMLSAAQALQLCGPWHTAQKPAEAALRHVALQVARMLENGLD
ncbi:YheC/YheD family protein, partial [Microbacteriaceae bacterium K1510]|nr:YheC/YheD family protein [Microbacteriaceae bacterium K1510]